LALERKKGIRTRIQNDIEQTNAAVEDVSERRDHAHEAQQILQVVAKKTQQELEYAINELVTLCMSGVFQTDAYNAIIDFVVRRNKTEADIYYERNGHRIHPLDGGGGAVNVGAYGLRMALWHLQTPRSRNTFLLDEPFPQLKGAKPNEWVLKSVRRLCKKLGIQIIMVSDERVPRKVTLKNADRVFDVNIENGRSYLEVLK
jgi:hypothetical protein